MHQKNAIAIVVFLFWSTFLLIACTNNGQSPTPTPQYALTYLPTVTKSPTVTPTFTIPPTNTPIPIPTRTLTFTIAPECVMFDDEGKLYILHDKVFSHPGPYANELDQALAKAFPQWVFFQQKLDWYDEPVNAGQIIEDASFETTFQLNSAVTLVTVGMQLGWEPPSDGDLFYRARSVGKKLNQLFFEYIDWKYFDEYSDKETQVRYLEVANPATYAIYAFFDYDQAALSEWCETYQRLYGQSPLSVP